MDIQNALSMQVSTEPITTQASSNQLGAMYCGDLNYDWYHHNWQPAVIHEYYPWYGGTTIIHEDKYSKAFAIAKMLLKDKLLVSAKVVDFIALVERVASIL
jgi:hypothetical protein